MGDANHGGTRLTGVTGTERVELAAVLASPDRKSTRLNSSHLVISYAVFCLKKKKKMPTATVWHLHWWATLHDEKISCTSCRGSLCVISVGGPPGTKMRSAGFVFFFNDTATTEIYTLSLHDALPISSACGPPTGRRAFSGWTRRSAAISRSEEHTSELQSPCNLVCRLLLEKKKV